MRKKSETSNLEKRRKNFLNLGFVVASSLTLLAFEYQTGNRYTEDILLEDPTGIEDEIVLKVKELKEQPKKFKPIPEEEKGNDRKIVKDLTLKNTFAYS